jgi:hypothetical protein
MAGEPADVARMLVASPGRWFVIASCPVERRHILGQSAHRLRSGRFAAFNAEAPPGTWDVRVVTDRGADAEEAVKAYARYLPGG